MSAPFNHNDDMENARLKRKRLEGIITLTGNTTLASCTVTSDIPGVRAYIETTSGANPTFADTGALLPQLQSESAPSTVGIVALCGDAKRFDYGRVTVISSASMTAGTVSKYGASSSGVTASKNLSVLVSCTGLDLDSAAATTTFFLELFYEQE